MYSTILVPLDGSGRAELILGHVEGLALKLGSSVILLRVIEPVRPIVDPHESRVAIYLEEVKRREEEARAYLAAKQGELRGMGIETEILVASGPTVETIINVASEQDVSLIAMASHGRTGLANVFYGGVAAGVLNRVDRPLLLIRARRELPEDKAR
jgi:nucleotide-binding universal stress UspA family protein